MDKGVIYDGESVGSICINVAAAAATGSRLLTSLLLVRAKISHIRVKSYVKLFVDAHIPVAQLTATATGSRLVI